jgi:hypothetical protein
MTGNKVGNVRPVRGRPGSPLHGPGGSSSCPGVSVRRRGRRNMPEELMEKQDSTRRWRSAARTFHRTWATSAMTNTVRRTRDRTSSPDPRTTRPSGQLSGIVRQTPSGACTVPNRLAGFFGRYGSGDVVSCGWQSSRGTQPSHTAIRFCLPASSARITLALATSCRPHLH